MGGLKDKCSYGGEKMRKRIIALLMALVACGSLVFAQAQTARKPKNGKKYQIVMVAKVEGYAWFDNMRLGVQKFAADHPDVDAYQVARPTRPTRRPRSPSSTTSSPRA